MKNLRKIISGGQTGVDQAALKVAQELGFDIGGWCPPDRLSEEGPIPYPLTPTPQGSSRPDIPRSQRTEWNVRDADATLIFEPKPLLAEDPGTRWTKTCCSRMKKPFLVCDPYDPEVMVKIPEWLTRIDPTVLNIAGPSEKTAPGISGIVYNILTNTLSREHISKAMKKLLDLARSCTPIPPYPLLS